jgi:hypothetical protein
MARRAKIPRWPRTRAEGETDAEFERRLLKDPRFLKRTDMARESLRQGRYVRLEDVEWD